MRIHLLTVGRDRRGPTAELVATYLKRCPWKIELIEIPQQNRGEPERRRREEAEKIRQSLPPGAAIAILDERGDDLTSRKFAERIERFSEEGRPALAFIIGGADGLDPALVAEADLRLAFGRAVWPHRLVKAMLAEQLYRASTILSGHPYHRD
ncbi:MAG: 23S rRNA (pseudouridine(1915)-N(3))-methyltransferase RlmH [Geminicoccaceae bacterium]